MPDHTTEKDDAPFAPLGEVEPQSQHAFWGTDPSGYCGCSDCEPPRVTPPSAADA